MLLSELMNVLADKLNEYGDREVFFYDRMNEATVKVDGKTFSTLANRALEKFYDAGDSAIKADIDNGRLAQNSKVIVIS